MNKQISKFIYLLPFFFGASWLFYFMLKNTVPVDIGDGLMHYFIAQATWEKPVLFLDHWGKPLFSLLSSPFAQFGLKGMVTFNILVYILSCFGIFKILDHLKVNGWFKALFPLIILIPNDYSMTILAGLTEPLFNLFLIVAALFLIKKKWAYFTLVVSFMPFLRSEGQLPLVLALMLLVYFKQWKIIPLLLAGFLLYAFIGWLALDNFWWYFTDSPYSMDNSIYGKGSWAHYLLSYRNYIGNPGLLVVAIGFSAALYLILKKRWQQLQFPFTFFVCGVFFGIIVLHSYFWATGQNGSLGLTRIATQGMPLFLCLMLYYIQQMEWANSKIAGVITVGLTVLIGNALFHTSRYPQKESALDDLVAKTTKLILPELNKGKRVFYHYPLVPFLLEENLKLKSEKSKFYEGFRFEKQCNGYFKRGDLLLWDSHFGPQEMGLSMERMAAQKKWVLVLDEFRGSDQVKVFQFWPLDEQVEVTETSSIHIPDQSIEMKASDEFYNFFSDEKLPIEYETFELEITPRNDGFRIVFENGTPEECFSREMKSKVVNKLSFRFIPNQNCKLYIWNPEKREGVIDVKNVIGIKKELHPFI